MTSHLSQFISEIYTKCGFEISDLKTESESKEYTACRFKINGLNVVSRNAKITPKKAGQFVTFWKRNKNEPIEPFNDSDQINFFVVNVKANNRLGQFVFPKSVLLKIGIISTDKKEGKRAFRVYPSWDLPKSKQAGQTQKWQLNYFYEINAAIDVERVVELFKVKA